jgi:hypothetical protein
MLLIVGMEMRLVVRPAELRVHANDDPKESTELGHVNILHF